MAKSAVVFFKAQKMREKNKQKNRENAPVNSVVTEEQINISAKTGALRWYPATLVNTPPLTK